MNEYIATHDNHNDTITRSRDCDLESKSYSDGSYIRSQDDVLCTSHRSAHDMSAGGVTGDRKPFV